MSELKTIKLYGELGEKFGKEFQFAVSSPAEAVRLLSANFKDFRQFFIGEDGRKEYHVLLNEQDLDAEETFYPSSTKEVIKIIPVVEGSGNNPMLRVVIGVALVVWGGPAGTTWATSLGFGLIVGGVSQLLFPLPDPVMDTEKDANRPAYNFDGPVNTVRQGNPVPIGYGTLRVGSQVISAGFYSEGFRVGNSDSVETEAVGTLVGY